MMSEWLRRFPWVLPVLILVAVPAIGMLFLSHGGPHRSQWMTLVSGIVGIVAGSAMVFQLRGITSRRKLRLGVLLSVIGMLIQTIGRIVASDTPAIPVSIVALILFVAGGILCLLDLRAIRSGG
jgi:hypothetical protein